MGGEGSEEGREGRVKRKSFQRYYLILEKERSSWGERLARGEKMKIDDLECWCDHCCDIYDLLIRSFIAWWWFWKAIGWWIYVEMSSGIPGVLRWVRERWWCWFAFFLGILEGLRCWIMLNSGEKFRELKKNVR